MRKLFLPSLILSALLIVGCKKSDNTRPVKVRYELASDSTATFRIWYQGSYTDPSDWDALAHHEDDTIPAINSWSQSVQVPGMRFVDFGVGLVDSTLPPTWVSKGSMKIFVNDKLVQSSEVKFKPDTAWHYIMLEAK